MNKLVYKTTTFTQDDIASGSVHMAMSLRSSSLEVNTLSADVKDLAGALRNFSRNDPLTWFYDDAQRGIFYLQEVERIGPSRYSIYATSAIGILTEGQHYGGIYTGQTAEEIISDICGTVPFTIQSKYAGVKLYGWLPIAAPRDNLVQVLIAIGAWIKTDLDGVLRIEGLWDGVICETNMDYLLEGAKVPETAKITQISVTEHQYAEGGEETNLFEGTASQGDVVTFREPMYDLVASGFSILESGANYAKVSSGTGTLTGKSYIHNTREIIRDVLEAAEPNIKSVKDATLVSLVNSVAVAERMANYYQWTETIQSPVIYQGEIPGNRVATWHPYDKEAVTACLESSDINLSNTLRANEKMLIGFVPPKYESSQYYDYREVLTGSGNWTVPEGVTNVRYVLFSGAQGGKAGLKGGTSGGSKSHSYTKTSWVTGEVTAQGTIQLWGGAGGKGGSGGDGGKGSKVLEGSMNVTPGQVLPFQCGIGGDGALYSDSASVDGNEGGATTFNGATSDNGAYPASSGWVDPITSEVYAASGPSGLSGGDGAGAVPGHTIPSNEMDLNIVLRYQPSTAAFDENGKSWAGAPTREISSGVAYWQTFDTNDKGNAGAWAGYALGPGGVAGVTQGMPSNRGSNSTTYAQATNGLTPPAPTAVPAKPQLTYGGRGGYGGGGGSCPSWAGFERNPSAGGPSGSANPGSPGAGGPGGKGGPGGDGCIILFYNRPKPIEAGVRKDKNGKVLLDRLNRLTIV